MFTGQTNVTSCTLHACLLAKAKLYLAHAFTGQNQSYILHACFQARPMSHLARMFTGQRKALSRAHVYRPKSKLHLACMFTGQTKVTSCTLHACLQAKIKVTSCMHVSRSNQSYMIYKCAGQIKVTLSTDVHKSIQTYIFHACAQVSPKLNLFNT